MALDIMHEVREMLRDPAFVAQTMRLQDHVLEFMHRENVGAERSLIHLLFLTSTLKTRINLESPGGAELFENAARSYGIH